MFIRTIIHPSIRPSERPNKELTTMTTATVKDHFVSELETAREEFRSEKNSATVIENSRYRDRPIILLVERDGDF